MSARGQSLVLMSLCLLFIVLMAMMTLGIGQRVREKIQLQALTDTAAFTDAMLVARTYNEISLSNRGIVGDEVAMAATYSLVSYASAWAADAQAAQAAIAEAQGPYREILDDCARRRLPATNPRCACAGAALGHPSWAAAQLALDAELARVAALPLDSLDVAAARQANDYREHALAMHEHASRFLNDELSFAVSPYQVAKTIARAAGAPAGELKVPVANDSISLREAHEGLFDEASGPHHDAFVDIGRGTRYSFVLERTEAAVMNDRFANVLTGIDGVVVTATHRGTADWERGNSVLAARDTTTISVSFTAAGPECGPSSATRSVRSSVVTATLGHDWPSGRDSDPLRHELVACEALPACTPPTEPLYDFGTLGRGTAPPTPRCTLPRCRRTENIGSMPRLATAAAMAQAMSEGLQCGPCPGVWPPYLGHSCEGRAADLFCQPKQYAIIQRDYAARETADPRNVAFTLRFRDGARLDLRRLALRDGTDISRQTAVAGGLAYYHYRGGLGWAETPNLMNPFWRAMLAPMDVDATGDLRASPTPGRDLPNFLLQSMNSESDSSRSASVVSHDALLELVANGFQGVQ